MPPKPRPSAPFNLKHIVGDVFSVPDNVSLAHCVGADMSMVTGIAVIFRVKYGCVEELLSQNVQPGGVAVLKQGDRFIYYLVTKKHIMDRPTYVNMSAALDAMRDHMKANKVTQLAMPRIGCGIDGLQWEIVQGEIKRAFFNARNVTITVYSCAQ